ncbi:type II toxin-antitoxin system HicB family antitoxin [Methanoregula sp.]|jgi:predicted RNase H-like HicB family nuclease|uniref:type II toxin-antitoxin system HicB family antitoxin n=1 Tax=Methanoregula sp. TaxID=2052170 RepID=UPI003C21D706
MFEKQGMHNYVIIIEKAGKNFSAYSPDFPGCIATGKTREETEERMHEAIGMHVREQIESKRSILVVRAHEAKKNVRENYCRQGTAQDLLIDLNE